MRFQEASIDELEVSFYAACWLRLAFGLPGKNEYSGKEETEDKQRQCQLLERVPRDIC